MAENKVKTGEEAEKKPAGKSAKTSAAASPKKESAAKAKTAGAADVKEKKAVKTTEKPAAEQAAAKPKAEKTTAAKTGKVAAKPKAEQAAAKPKAEKEPARKTEATETVKAEVEKPAKASSEKKPAKSAGNKDQYKRPVSAQRNRLKKRYLEEVVPALMGELGYTNVMQVPTLHKITLNMRIGDIKDNSKSINMAMQELEMISGQKAVLARARKSVANFKLREGQPIGIKVTLRGEKMFEFFDKLVSINLPRVRDFRGVSPKSFDGRGNYSLGVKEQLIFPEISYELVEKVRGFDINIVTTANSDAEAKALLAKLGMPFKN